MQENNPDKPDYNSASSGQAQGERNYRYDYEGDKLINDPAALTIAIIHWYFILWVVFAMAYHQYSP